MERRLPKSFWILFPVVIFVPTYFHPQLDYQILCKIWNHILAGGNPWSETDGSWTSNTYGPLFVPFAYLYAIHAQIPGMLFRAAWLLLAARVGHGFWFLALTLNPFFWITIVAVGQFDAIPAFTCVLAFQASQKHLPRSAALWLAAGTLLKFYPLLFLPFLVLDRSLFRTLRERKELLVWTLGFVIAGLIVAACFWGLDVTIFFRRNIHRVVSLITPFRLLHEFGIKMDFLSFPLVCLSYFYIVYLAHKYHWQALVGCVVGLTTVLAIHKLANPQHYTVLFFLLALCFEHIKSTQMRTAVVRWQISVLSAVTLAQMIWYLEFLNGTSGTWDVWTYVPIFIAHVLTWPRRLLCKSHS